jgi:SAM-dependent methyltransferase
MRYEVEGLTVRAENAAQSADKPNAHVLSWIEVLDHDGRILDYGCGKLRYTIPLAGRTRQVVGVDSAVQLDRAQVVGGCETTVRRYVAEHLENVTVVGQDEPRWRDGPGFDAALCANVLSAIPDRAVRVGVLRDIGASLGPDGRLLACTQYRHSSFAGYAESDRARRYGDGWLIVDARNPAFAHFYGLIDKESLVAHCADAGLRVVRAWVNGKSAYVEAASS